MLTKKGFFKNNIMNLIQSVTGKNVKNRKHLHSGNSIRIPLNIKEDAYGTLVFKIKLKFNNSNQLTGLINISVYSYYEYKEDPNATTYHNYIDCICSISDLQKWLSIAMNLEIDVYDDNMDIIKVKIN